MTAPTCGRPTVGPPAPPAETEARRKPDAQENGERRIAAALQVRVVQHQAPTSDNDLRDERHAAPAARLHEVLRPVVRLVGEAQHAHPLERQPAQDRLAVQARATPPPLGRLAELGGEGVLEPQLASETAGHVAPAATPAATVELLEHVHVGARLLAQNPGNACVAPPVGDVPAGQAQPRRLAPVGTMPRPGETPVHRQPDLRRRVRGSCDPPVAEQEAHAAPDDRQDPGPASQRTPRPRFGACERLPRRGAMPFGRGLSAHAEAPPAAQAGKTGTSPPAAPAHPGRTPPRSGRACRRASPPGTGRAACAA